MLFSPALIKNAKEILSHYGGDSYTSVLSAVASSLPMRNEQNF